MLRQRISSILACVFFILVLASCGFKNPEQLEQDILAHGEELRNLTASQSVSVVDEPYLGATAVPMSDTDRTLARHMSLSLNGTLSDVCAATAPLTGLAWQIEDGTADTVRRVRYAGSLENFCRYLAALYGYQWRFDQDTQSVLFSHTGTRTFTLLAAPGKVIYKNQITNQSKENNSSSGGAFGQTVSASDISSQTAQSNTSDLTLDVWNEALTTIKSLLSKTGAVSANVASGTVTVTDTAPVLRRVESFVHDFNRKLSRQVAVEVRVWQLAVNDESDVGLNLQALFEDGKMALATGASLNWAKTGGELLTTVTGGKLKGSQATLKALSSYGKTTLVTSGSGVTMNNQPLPIENTVKDTYLASMSLNTNDYGQTSQIVPGEITTGFAMTVIPHILDRRTLILQYSASLTAKDAMREYTNENVRVEMPTVSTRAFSQRVTMRMGQTLVLAGFEQESHGKDNTVGLLAAGRKGQYGRALIIITISVESMPGYEEGEIARFKPVDYFVLPALLKEAACAA